MKTPLSILGALLLPAVAYAGSEDASPHPTFPSPRHSGEGQIAFTSNNVALLAWKTLSDFSGGNTSANDCWGYTSPSGREYAIIGLSNGTGFVEITDPGAPQIISFKSAPVNSLWRSVKAHGAYAYAGSEGNFATGGGIQVFDMTQIDAGIVTTLPAVTTGGCNESGGSTNTMSHTLAVDNTSGYLYRCGGGSSDDCDGGPQGLVIYSLANPAAPSFVSDWSIGRYVHEAQVVTWDIAGPHFGKQIAFCYTETSTGGGDPRLTILDVTNKLAITQMASITYGGSFSHQGWLSANKQHLYLNDETDGNPATRIFNVSSLTAPTTAGSFSAPGATSIDHNLYVVGNRIFESNYTSGLRVFDNTTPTAPTQIGFFDTWPQDNSEEFNSLWSNYPFFPSGTIIGGDIEKGLFVWRYGARLLTFDYPSGLPEFIAPSGGTVQFEVNENAPGDLQPGTVEFHFGIGAGFTTVSATHMGGNLYQANVPALDCGDEIEFYVSAQSIDGVTWTDPEAGPTQVHLATAAVDEIVMHTDNMESATAWLVNQAGDLTGFSTASTGTWTRVNPVGTSAQPEDDHTSPGTFAWVTGQGTAGGGDGDADVDGGATSLRSPLFTAAGMNEPYVVYWRWYSNSTSSSNPGTNVFTVDISNNNGSSWVNLETVGPTGDDVLGGWIEHRARIADFVTPTANMRLRFRASDLTSSVVEAGVDDFQVVDLDCEPEISIASLSDTSGNIRGGDVITITGNGFVTGITGVQFGPNAGNNVQVLSPTQLSVRVPPAGGPGLGKLGRMDTVVDVTVTLGAASATLPNAYTYVLPPRSF